MQFAKNELKEIAKNGGSRMMVEIIDGTIQVDPHVINGIAQHSSNGFDNYWANWNDINEMVGIANQHLIQNTNYPIKRGNLVGEMITPAFYTF